MNKFLLLFFHLLPFFTSAQVNYTGYYQKVNIAEKLKIEKQYKNAFDKYYEAFELNFPFIQDINNFIELSDKLSFKDSIVERKIEIILMLQKIFFVDEVFNNSYHIISRSKTNDSTKNVLIKSFSYINEDDFLFPNKDIVDFSTQINELLYIDQFIRKLKLYDFTCKDSLLANTDKKNRDKVILMLTQKGFPNRKSIGNQNIHFLLLHISLYMDLNTIDSLLLPEIISGNYHPSQYARLVDRYRTWVLNKPQIYGEWVDETYFIEDIEKVDERREQIGLNPLYVFCYLNNISLPKNYNYK